MPYVGESCCKMASESITVWHASPIAGPIRDRIERNTESRQNDDRDNTRGLCCRGSKGNLEFSIPHDALTGLKNRNADRAAILM